MGLGWGPWLALRVGRGAFWGPRTLHLVRQAAPLLSQSPGRAPEPQVGTDQVSSSPSLGHRSYSGHGTKPTVGAELAALGAACPLSYSSLQVESTRQARPAERVAGVAKAGVADSTLGRGPRPLKYPGAPAVLIPTPTPPTVFFSLWGKCSHWPPPRPPQQAPQRHSPPQLGAGPAAVFPASISVLGNYLCQGGHPR